MKRLLSIIILFVFIGIGTAQAQYGLQLSTLIPSGDYYPYLLKPSIGAQLSFEAGDNKDRDSQYKIGFALGYYIFKPTQETFSKTYSIGGNPVQLLPGYEVIHSYSILQMGLTNDFKILSNPKLSPVVGMDIFINVLDISDDYYAETFISSSNINDYEFNYGIVPRLGMEYDLNDQCKIKAGLGRSMGFLGSIGQQAFWKPYLTVVFYKE